MNLTTIDESLARLRDNKAQWARLPIEERIRYLEQIRDLLVANADAWVAAGVRMKDLDPRSPFVGGEEWLGGPYPTAAWITDMIGTLTLFYNRSRQALITKELMEIVGGAEALKG